MKRVLMVIALAAVATATYVATATGAQQARGPTARQFKALKSQVARLTTGFKVVKALAVADTVVLLDCMSTSVPIKQFGNGADGFAGTTGYSYTDPAANGGTPYLKPAYAPTAIDDPNALWITGGTSKCGTDINGALRKVGRLASIGLQRH
jgi:hypothetical protein